MFLAGTTTPTLFAAAAAAVLNFGVKQLLDVLVDIAPAPPVRCDVTAHPRPVDAPFSAFVFKIQAGGCRGRWAGVASAGDNAAMESWHALLHKLVPDLRRWRRREELHEAIGSWTEHTYNRRRRQRALGKLTPVE